ncbi:MAG: hypothetical protein WB797_09435, partial [Nocardioides sp.]
TATGVAAVPLANASAEGGRAATSLAIRVVHPSVKPGGTDTVTGALGVAGPGTPAGRVVTLEARPMGATSFTPVGDATARDHGGLTETVTPDVTTRYRWHYAGDTDARPSVSGVAVVRVRTHQHPAHRIPTSLSVRAVHRVAKRDGIDVIRGRLRAGRVSLPHRRVILVSRTAGASWTFVGAHRTRRHGAVAFRVEPAADTAYRLVFLGTPLLRPARSAVVRVISRPDLTISAAPKRIDSGDTTTISGTATDDGAPVAGGTVKLLARKVGSKHGLHLVGTGTTAADGSVSFTDTPAVSTVYRLHLLRAPGQPGTDSHRTRVFVRIATSLSIRGKEKATEFVVSGELRGGGHALAGRTVTLLEQAPGSATWTEAGTDQTGPHGVARFHEPLVPGTGYRLAYAGGPRFAPSSSGTVVS